MKKHIKWVVYTSIIIMFFTAINNTNLGILSQLTSQNGNHWVGPLSVALIFFGSGSGSLYNRYINRWRYRWVIFIGSLGWIFFNGLSVIFLFIGFQEWVISVILIGSTICGLTVSIFYNGIFNLINEFSMADQQKSKYFAINMGLTQISNIIGNFISSLLIERLGQKSYSVLMFGIAFCISLFFLVLPRFSFDQKQKNKSDQSNSEINSLITYSAEQFPKTQDEIPLNLYFCFGLSGVIISFIYSQFSIIFYKAFVDEDKESLNRITFMASTIEGVGELVGGIFMLIYSSKILSKVKYFIFTSKLFLVAIILIYLGSVNKSLILMEIGGFLVGVADCITFIIALQIAGKWSKKGYSLFNIGQSSMVGIVVCLNIFLHIQDLFLVYLLVHVLSCLSLIANQQRID